MSKIRKIILNLKGFQYTTSLGLNMGYYHINIKKASKLCTIILTWVKYKYTHIPMGLCNSPDISKRKLMKWSVELNLLEHTLMTC